MLKMYFNPFHLIRLRSRPMSIRGVDQCLSDRHCCPATPLTLILWDTRETTKFSKSAGRLTTQTCNSTIIVSLYVQPVENIYIDMYHIHQKLLPINIVTIEVMNQILLPQIRTMSITVDKKPASKPISVLRYQSMSCTLVTWVYHHFELVKLTMHGKYECWNWCHPSYKPSLGSNRPTRSVW